MRGRRWFAALAVVVSAGLLAAMATSRLQRTRPDYADAYHAEVRRVVAAMPETMGRYAAHDRSIPTAAYELLKPNTTRARALLDANGRTVGTLVVVHCRDAEDLRGHYPPVCYPASGYRDARPPRRVDVELDGATLPATEYAFIRGDGHDASRLTVLNFMVLPTGEVQPDATGLSRLASDYRQRFFGAGQFQVLVDPAWPPARREAFYEEVLAAVGPIIETIRDRQAGSPEPTLTETSP